MSTIIIEDSFRPDDFKKANPESKPKKPEGSETSPWVWVVIGIMASGAIASLIMAVREYRIPKRVEEDEDHELSFANRS